MTDLLVKIDTKIEEQQKINNSLNEKANNILEHLNLKQ
jgi:hypothetical protein